MKKLTVLISVIIILASCAKEKESKSFCVNAMVRWGGPPAADGMGWYLIVDSTRGISYIPKNLPENYKVDDLQVNVCLSKTNEKFSCMCASPVYKYEITSISKL